MIKAVVTIAEMMRALNAYNPKDFEPQREFAIRIQKAAKRALRREGHLIRRGIPYPRRKPLSEGASLKYEAFLRACCVERLLRGKKIHKLRARDAAWESFQLGKVFTLASLGRELLRDADRGRKNKKKTSAGGKEAGRQRREATKDRRAAFLSMFKEIKSQNNAISNKHAAEIVASELSKQYGTYSYRTVLRDISSR